MSDDRTDLDLAIEAGANVVIISNIYRPQFEPNPKRSIARKGIFQVMSQSMSTLLMEKERRGVELLQKRYPHVTFIDIAPDLGSYGYFNRFAARSVVMRGYGTALRALATAKENHVFDGAMPADSLRGLRSVG